RHVANTQLEVFPVGIDCANHDFVPEDKLKIDTVSGDRDHLVTASDAGEHEHAILAEGLHAVEHDRGVARAFEDKVKRTVLFGSVEDWRFFGRDITRAELFDKIGIQIRFGAASKRSHIQT